MRKITFFFTALAVFGLAYQVNAQLFVKGNSYVYNKGSYVFVKGDVELEANSNIYLRQEGQLLQGGTTLNGSNKGTGTLSVFQEGTVNSYAYNYWCAPVGNTSAATTGNRDFGVTLLGVPTNTPTATIGFNPVTTTTSSYNGSSSTGAATISTFWIYKYSIPSNSYTGWQSVGAATSISAGQGFTMKGVNGDDTTNVGETTVNNPTGADGQRYDFRGKPNDGDISIDVGENLYTLTGNPYPSAIDLSVFLTDPLNNILDGVAYFWEQDKNVNSHNVNQYRGGYSAFNGTSLVGTGAIFSYFDLGGNPVADPTPPFLIPYHRRFSPVGQGFLVKGKSPGGTGTVRMRNAYRVFVKEGDGVTDPNLSHFERNANASTSIDYGFYDPIPNVAGTDYTQISKAPTPHIRLNSTLNGNPIRQMALCFMNTAIDGVDRADTRNPDEVSNLPYDAYMVLEGNQYIHTTTSFGINKRFPIGFKNAGTENAFFRVQVYEFVNFDSAEHVYLYDNVTGLYHEIVDNYYEVMLPPGVHNNRFEITFTNQTLGLETNFSDNFIIVQNNPDQQLSISNPNLLDVKSVALYDITGKSIFSKTGLGIETAYHFPTASLSEGVYVVQLQTVDNQSLSQKIIVKRKN